MTHCRQETSHPGRSDEMEAHGGQVPVFVRFRPTANFAHGLIECAPDGQTVKIYNRKDSSSLQGSKKGQLNPWSLQVEGILQDVFQKEVYFRVCQQVVQGALDGYNGTVMCFGQTGAGKTYTMTGSTESYEHRGIIPRALQEVFQEVRKRTEHFVSVHLSYLEIYNESLVDLLSPVQGSSHQLSRGMVVMEEPGGGVFIRGLSLHPVYREEDALNLLFEGDMNRIKGSHAMNRNSSRSHCIFTVHIESRSRTLSDAMYITSKLNLVDLAGSERLGKTGSEGQIVKEATYINESLSFLEQAILALADGPRDHVPFRQTKLTHVLKDSLGGNCNTVFVANIYGEAAQIEETLSTLRFASRMKCVRTDPVVNEHMDPARPIITYEPLSAQLADIDNQVERYLDGSLELFRGWDTKGSNEDVKASTSGASAQSQKQAQHPSSTTEKPMKSRDEQSQNKRWGEGIPFSSKQMESASESELNSDQISEREQETPDTESPDTQESHQPDNEHFYLDLLGVDSFPQSKEDAFENFMLGQHPKVRFELERAKKDLLFLHSYEQQLKREADLAAVTVRQHRATQGTQGQYTEPESIKDLTKKYNQSWKLIHFIQTDIISNRRFLNTYRRYLLPEFETWYKNNFLLSEEELKITEDKTLAQKENKKQCLEQLETEPLIDSSRIQTKKTCSTC